MHRLQAEFIDGIAAFRSIQMAEAPARLLEAYGAVACSDATHEELSWLCRESLYELEVGWDVHTMLDMPEIPVRICLHITMVRLRRGGQTAGLRVQMFVAKTMPEELQARWEALGFTEEPIFIEQAAVRFPVPLDVGSYSDALEQW